MLRCLGFRWKVSMAAKKEMGIVLTLSLDGKAAEAGEGLLYSGESFP